MGYRIESIKGPDGGYCLQAGSDLPPLLFDDDQAIAITVALQAATMTGAGIEEAALRALKTMRQMMPSRLRHRLDALQFTTIHSGPAEFANSVSPEILIALSAAARAHEILRFDYPSHTVGSEAHMASPRQVEPHHLVASRARWYLVAWDLEREDWRIFRADRITPRTPSGPRFTPRDLPADSVHDFVSARFKGSASSNTWPCTAKVILGLPASAVTPFAGDGTVEDLGAGRCSLECGSWSWISLAASFGRIDTDVEVVNSPELSTAFGQLATRYRAAARPNEVI